MQFYGFIRGIANIVFKLIYRIEVNGKENIPKDGNLVLCSNHQHVFDPIIISIVFPRQIHWMAKKELFKGKILSKLIYKLGAFPVDRGESDLSAIKNALRVLKKDNVLGIFPEGTRVKGFDIKNAKPGVALIAVKSQSLVLPVHIEGNFKLFSRIKINFGKPMDLKSNDGKRLTGEDYQELGKDILTSIYLLKPMKEGR